MLQNADLLAKIGADTAENERNFADNLPDFAGWPTAETARKSYALKQSRADAAAGPVGWLRNFGKISAKFRSFSAVSAPIFASKYAFFSIFLNLQDYLPEFSNNWQIFCRFANFEFAEGYQVARTPGVKNLFDLI